MKANIRWISFAAAANVQQKMVKEFGGMNGGVRDVGLLESALNRPKNMHSYNPDEKFPDYGALAASYAYGIAKNHPFFDANKRTGFQVMELFLGLNGLCLRASDEACVEKMCAMAASDISLEQFESWVKKNIGLASPPAQKPAPKLAKAGL